MEQAFFRAAQARAQAPGAPANVFDIEKVAEGVYAAVARPAGVTNCNAAIFENARDLLVVDTHSKPSAVASLAAQIGKEISSKPVRYIVNTHFHWDHTQGAPEYRRLAPAADIISSSATRKLLAEFGAARLKASLEQVSAGLEEWQKKLAAARTAEDKAYYERMVSEMRAYLGEMRGVEPELPNLTFSENLVLHDRAHDLHLAFRGRGHTAGDVVVFCPQKKVMATGDLVHGWLPYLGDAYPKEWPGTIEAVAKFNFTQVIGGHGGVQHSRERLGQFSGYIRELTEAVDAGKRKGESVERLQAAITPSSLRSLGAGYGDFVGAQITKYDGPQMRVSPQEVVAGAVRSNIADIFKALDRA
jgi:glyoxylase-like metal-dependent hydrolase (beta-lactamase superfamily II)